MCMSREEALNEASTVDPLNLEFPDSRGRNHSFHCFSHFIKADLENHDASRDHSPSVKICMRLLEGC